MDLQTVQETLALEEQDNLVNNGADRLLLEVDDEVSLGGRLVRVVDTGEALDVAVARLLVDAALVRLLGVLERGGDVHEEEGAGLLDQLASLLAGLVEWRNGRSDDGGAGAGEL